jgi:hypothetical protein
MLDLLIVAPLSIVLLDKLIGSPLVKKFPAFYETRRFITELTSARHLFIFCGRSIQSMPLHATTQRSILILFSHLRVGLPSGLFPSRFPTKTLYKPLRSRIRATCPAYLILLDLISRKILNYNVNKRCYLLNPGSVCYTT